MFQLTAVQVLENFITTISQERYLNTVRCNKAFTNAKTDVLHHDELYLHILEIFLFSTTG